MEFIIVNLESKLLLGLTCNVTLADVEARMTFNLVEQFKSRISEIESVVNGNTLFGLSTDPENYNPETDRFEYFIGVEVQGITTAPKDMVLREIPSSQYVVFTFEGPAENAGHVHRYLYSNWLSNNEYQLSGTYNFEVYDERNKGPYSEESLTDIYFPIKKAE